MIDYHHQEWRSHIQVSTWSSADVLYWNSHPQLISVENPPSRTPEQHSASPARGSNWRRKAKNNLDWQHHVVVGHEILPRSCKNGARPTSIENSVIQPTPRGRNIEVSLLVTSLCLTWSFHWDRERLRDRLINRDTDRQREKDAENKKGRDKEIVYFSLSMSFFVPVFLSQLYVFDFLLSFHLSCQCS